HLLLTFSFTGVTWPRCSPVRRSVVEPKLRHWVVLTVARPQLRVARDRTRRNQSVAEFHCVALLVPAQVFSGSAPDRNIGWDANESLEQGFERLVFARTGSSPKFRGAYG